MTIDTSGTTRPDTVVLIHGLYLNYQSWENWVTRYESRGLTVLAPGWPGMERSVEELRRDPTPIANMQVEDVLEHYERIIRALPSKPIIIGHSFGGTFMQVLVDRGLAAAAVGIAAGTVRGIRDLPLDTVRSNWLLLRNPLARKRAVMMTPEQFRFGFTNTWQDEAVARAAYERYAVPGARNVLFSVPFSHVRSATALKVDWGRPGRAPMLFIAGGKDRVVPASVNRSNYKKYVKENPGAITAIKEYPTRSHFTAAEEGWEAIADFALDWALKPVPGVLDVAPPPTAAPVGA
jgi:pimeloyl-ACP methyl ester carboxylesterase